MERLVQKPFVDLPPVCRPMRRTFAIALAAILAVTQTVWAGEVSLHGSTTVMNTLIVPNKAEIEERSGQQLRLVGNGSQRGIADLVAGRAEIAMISAPLAEELIRLSEKTPGEIDSERFNKYVIGESRVAFAVHPSNPVRILTNKRLAGIFAGKLRNWKDLGGADQEIIIVTAQPGDGLRAMVEGKLLNGANLPSGARAMTNATQIAKVVSQLPGGIGMVAPPSLDGSVAELRGDEPIVQPLILVTMGEETPEVRRVVEAAIVARKSSCSNSTIGAEPDLLCKS
jgi:phosphate transport system substrate-binding protein